MPQSNLSPQSIHILMQLLLLNMPIYPILLEIFLPSGYLFSLNALKNLLKSELLFLHIPARFPKRHNLQSETIQAGQNFVLNTKSSRLCLKKRFTSSLSAKRQSSVLLSPYNFTRRSSISCARTLASLYRNREHFLTNQVHLLPSIYFLLRYIK